MVLVPCEPPKNFRSAVIDESSVNISWIPGKCRDGDIGTERFIIYIEDTIHDPKADWYIRGVHLDRNYEIIDFLSPGIKYRAYMVEATEIGNGPPSDKFYFFTKAARKNQSSDFSENF